MWSKLSHCWLWCVFFIAVRAARDTFFRMSDSDMLERVERELAPLKEDPELTFQEWDDFPICELCDDLVGRPPLQWNKTTPTHPQNNGCC